MSRIPDRPDHRSYFRMEALMEAPIWALVAAVLLMTAAVVVEAIARL